MSEQDIVEIEAVVLDRSNFFGKRADRIFELLEGVTDESLGEALDIFIIRNRLTNSFSEIDIEHSLRALELAAQGQGRVSPNPMVGCVITDAGGNVVGEGSYIYENVTHAEVIALEQAGDEARGGTAYVSLEPHSHQNRTPPCTEALINAGIKRVVCPIEDPNPFVSGKGFAALREAGIEVVTGILADEATRLNEKFIYWHRNQRPFVHLKMAISLDGRIATRTGDSRWITGPESLKKVHEMRHEFDAILVGSNTVLLDNPVLTDRSDRPRRRKLARVVLDNNLRIPYSSHLVQTAGEIPTIVITDSSDDEKIVELRGEGVEVVHIAEGGRNLQGVLAELAKRGIISVLVEGGTEVAGAFYDAKLIDKLSFFIAPIVIGGQDAPVAIGGRGSHLLSAAMRLKDPEMIRHGDDLEITGYPSYPESSDQ